MTRHADPFAGPEGAAVRRRVARGFDRLAPVYDLLGAVAFGGALRRTTRAALDRVADAERLLVLGGGRGAVFADLADAGFRGRIDAVDLSAGMTACARRRWRQAGREDPDVRFVVGTLDDLPAGRRYDAILAPFVLDLYPQSALESLARRMASRARPDARWVVVDFAPAPRRTVRSGVQSVLYAFFRLACGIPARRLPDVAAALEAAGWRGTRSDPGRGWFTAGTWRAPAPVADPR